MKTFLLLIIAFLNFRVNAAEQSKNFKSYFVDKGVAGVFWENNECGGILGSSEKTLNLQFEYLNPKEIDTEKEVLVAQYDTNEFKKFNAEAIAVTAKINGKEVIVNKSPILFQKNLEVIKVVFSKKTREEIKNSLELNVEFKKSDNTTKVMPATFKLDLLPRIESELKKCIKENVIKK